MTVNVCMLLNGSNFQCIEIISNFSDICACITKNGENFITELLTKHHFFLKQVEFSSVIVRTKWWRGQIKRKYLLRYLPITIIRYFIRFILKFQNNRYNIVIICISYSFACHINNKIKSTGIYYSNYINLISRHYLLVQFRIELDQIHKEEDYVSWI